MQAMGEFFRSFQRVQCASWRLLNPAAKARKLRAELRRKAPAWIGHSSFLYSQQQAPDLEISVSICQTARQNKRERKSEIKNCKLLSPIDRLAHLSSILLLLAPQRCAVLLSMPHYECVT